MVQIGLACCALTFAAGRWLNDLPERYETVRNSNGNMGMDWDDAGQEEKRRLLNRMRKTPAHLPLIKAINAAQRSGKLRALHIFKPDDESAELSRKAYETMLEAVDELERAIVSMDGKGPF